MSNGVSEEVALFFYDRDEIEVLALENHRPTVMETLIAIEPHIEPKDAYDFGYCILNRLTNLNLPDSERQQLVALFAKNLPRIQEAAEFFLDTVEILMSVTSMHATLYAENNAVVLPLDQVYALLQDCANNPLKKIEYQRPEFDLRLVHSPHSRCIQ
jgi:hypothetical protein